MNHQQTISRLEGLRDFLIKNAEGRFNWGVFAWNTEEEENGTMQHQDPLSVLDRLVSQCKSEGCVAGWCMVYAGEEWIRDFLDSIGVQPRDALSRQTEQAAAKFLGLTRGEADFLFLGTSFYPLSAPSEDFTKPLDWVIEHRINALINYRKELAKAQ